jgi:hypothetical protein
MSNNYDVEFTFNSSSGLMERFSSYGFEFKNGSTLSTVPTSSASIIKILCDEAQLPNVQSATGQTTGKYLGEGQVNYPHTRLYSDFQLSWMCDANMIPLKFLNTWYEWIFQNYDVAGTIINPKQVNPNTILTDIKKEAFVADSVRAVKLNYPNTYLANIVITKTERGRNAPNSRAPIAYTMIDAYPYSIDAIPLSYGASQITKVSANFYYAKHQVTYNNISKLENDSRGR